MFAAILTTLLFSLSALTGRRLSNFLPGSLANLLRLMLAAAVVGTYAHLFGFGISGPAFPWLLVSGCVGIGDLTLRTLIGGVLAVGGVVGLALAR